MLAPRPPRSCLAGRVCMLSVLSLAFVAAQARGQTLITLQSSIGPNAQVIDLDTGSTGLPTIPGLTFNQSGNATADGPESSAQFPGTFFLPGFGIVHNFFDHQYLGNAVGPAGYSSMEIDFATPVSGVGGFVQQVGSSGSSLGRSITLLVYGAGHTLLDQVTETLPSVFDPGPLFYGFVDPAGITSVVWEPGNGAIQAPVPGGFSGGGFSGGFIGVGQITYAFAAVPEPSSLALCGLGIAAFVGHRVRRRKAAAA